MTPILQVTVATLSDSLSAITNDIQEIGEYPDHQK